MPNYEKITADVTTCQTCNGPMDITPAGLVCRNSVDGSCPDGKLKPNPGVKVNDILTLRLPEARKFANGWKITGHGELLTLVLSPNDKPKSAVKYLQAGRGPAGELLAKVSSGGRLGFAPRLFVPKGGTNA